MIIEYIIITIYSLSLLLIFMYALSQLNLLFNYITSKRDTPNALDFESLDVADAPYITIQLPIYNEMYVVERLLRNISKIDYPKDKLEIQVLDDSTDESITFTKDYIEKLQKTGLDIKHITRLNRIGFKAGALKAGLKIAKGEIIAIFDADFLPEKNWLKKTVPYFKDESIGVVQTRWAHINKNYSLLTRVQAFALDAHFTLEQTGRNIKGHFINFNGTAGLWRKTCIIDAGNWEGDTLTEDLDLSYRAQLKKWKFKYLEDVKTPAELPIVVSAARSQQFRWNKGGAENFRKMFKRVVKSDAISLKTKAHGVLHLLNSTMFLNVFIVSILSVPMLYIKNEYAHLRPYFYVMSLFVVSTIIFFICYWFMYKNTHGHGIKNFITYIGMFFAFFSVAMGFSLHNSIAVLEGHFGKKSEFIRTPKFNLKRYKDNWKKNKYLKKALSTHVFFEGILMLYFGFGIYSAFIVGNQGGDFGLLPFHVMLFFGFAYIFFGSLLSKID